MYDVNFNNKYEVEDFTIYISKCLCKIFTVFKLSHNSIS